MRRLSITIPEELYQRLLDTKSRYQSFSGHCCSIMETGLKTRAVAESLIGKTEKYISVQAEVDKQ